MKHCAFLRYLCLPGLCLALSSCDQMKETMARKGELQDRFDTLTQEIAEMDPQIQELKKPIPAVLYTIPAATFHAEKLEKSLETQAQQLATAVAAYKAAEQAQSDLEKELVSMRNNRRP